jgi:YggT family protein
VAGEAARIMRICPRPVKHLISGFSFGERSLPPNFRGCPPGQGQGAALRSRTGAADAANSAGKTMEPLFYTIFQILYVVLDLYVWVLIISAILSWLIAFNVINTHNRFIYTVTDMLYRLTEPVLRPIRNVLPNLGGLDLSPIVVILIIMFAQRLLVNYGLV